MTAQHKARRWLVAALVVSVVLAFAYPWLEVARTAWRVRSMPAPQSLPVPVFGVKPARLADTWHATRPPARRHEGIDIFARKGTPVVAATDGVVVRRGEDPLGGNVVSVYGPAGQVHYYAHLDEFGDVALGDVVLAGDLLGTVGNTGNARTTPPHLHYGIYTDGGAINPYPLLTAAPSSARR